MARCLFPFQEDFYEVLKKRTNCKEIVIRQLQSSNGKRRHRKFKAFLEECKFKLVKDVFRKHGAIAVHQNDYWVIAWTDATLTMEKLSKILSYQKINHFPGMREICKKDLLACNLNKMQKALPADYNFFPLTFCLPEEAINLHRFCEGRKKNEIFIIKPDTSCQGSGIQLVQGMPKIKRLNNVVCQKYIKKPLLMDRYKFDLRLYVLITSVAPLRLYLYKDGLIRLATIPYKKPTVFNMTEKRMHLTNFAINKNPEEMKAQGTINTGCKKSLADLEVFMKSLGFSLETLWSRIDDMISKTVLAALPALEHMYHTQFPISSAVSQCFEVLGFDILLDSKGTPYLLEVNRSPSLGGSTDLDKELKQKLIEDVLNMVLLSEKQINFIKDAQHMKTLHRLTNPHATRHLTARERILAEYQVRREVEMMGDFRMLFPATDGRYDDILQTSFGLDKMHVLDRRSGTARSVKDVVGEVVR